GGRRGRGRRGLGGLGGRRRFRLGRDKLVRFLGRLGGRWAKVNGFGDGFRGLGGRRWFGLDRRHELGLGRDRLGRFLGRRGGRRAKGDGFGNGLGGLRIERAELDGLGYRLYHLGGHRRFELERWLWNLSGLLRLERGLRHFWCRGLRSGKGRDRGGRRLGLRRLLESGCGRLRGAKQRRRLQRLLRPGLGLGRGRRGRGLGRR